MPACPPNWDTLSGWQHPRKPCPKLSAQNGMYFPDGMPSGNRVPESRLKLGRSFRFPAVPKSTSHSGAEIRDAVSVCGGAPNKKAPARDKVEAKGAAYVVDVERERPVNNGRPRSTLPAATDAAVRRIHHGQIRTQLAVKCAIGVLYGGRRGNRCDLADALAAVCHGQ